jgi:hypothetical protein
LVSEDVDHGHIGVRGLLYFDFSVIGPEGTVIHPQGYARVREYANPLRPNNPTWVYTWRKDLAKKMCQPCSDAHGGPVPLTTNGCTKKKCKVIAAKKKDAGSAAAARVQQLPMDRPSRPEDHASADDVEVAPPNNVGVRAKPGRPPKDVQRPLADAAVGNASRKRKQPAEHETTGDVKRQVRVVHGHAQQNGKPQVWMYVPCEADTAKTNCAREGFWLDAIDQEPGLFSLRRAEHIQRLMGPVIQDVTVFPDFPFRRLVKRSKHGKEIKNTIRFVTARPLTEEELTKAKNGEDVAGPLDEIVDGADANDEEEDEDEHDDDDSEGDTDDTEDDDNEGDDGPYKKNAKHVARVQHSDRRRSSRHT